MLISNANFGDKSPIARFNRQWVELSPKIVGLPRIVRADELANLGATPTCSPSMLYITPRAERVLHPEARKALVSVPDSPEPLSCANLTFVGEPQLIETLKENHSDWGQGVECLSIVVATLACYQTFREGANTGFSRKTFCAVDVLLSILDALSWLPKVKDMADGLMIVHASWSVAGKVCEHVLPRKERKSVIATLRSGVGVIQKLSLPA
jgi:hypothetical protein